MHWTVRRYFEALSTHQARARAPRRRLARRSGSRSWACLLGMGIAYVAVTSFPAQTAAAAFGQCSRRATCGLAPVLRGGDGDDFIFGAEVSSKTSAYRVSPRPGRYRARRTLGYQGMALTGTRGQHLITYYAERPQVAGIRLLGRLLMERVQPVDLRESREVRVR